VSVRGQSSREQEIDPRPAEFIGRQADAVNDDELGNYSGRPSFKMIREDLADLHQKSG
jgi:hypothetical protein